MATKPQAKAAADAANASLKAEIDMLPAGVNITDGRVDFNPTKHYVRLVATDGPSAEAMVLTFVATLSGAGRRFTVRREGNYVNSEAENAITIVAPPTIFVITF